MKQDKLSVLFYPLKGRALKNGHVPITLRITYNKLKVETRIKRSVLPAHWDHVKERSRGRSREDIELNDYIDELRLRIREIHRERITTGKPVSAQIITDQLFGIAEEKITYLRYFDGFIAEIEKLKGIDYTDSTVWRYMRVRRYFGEFLRSESHTDDIPFEELNGNMIRQFEVYLKTVQKSRTNTVIQYLKCVKTVCLRAMGAGFLSLDPFIGIRFKKEEGLHKYLEWEDLRTIIRTDFQTNNLNLIKDLFLFLCYTGLSHIDAYNLTEENLSQDTDGNFIITTTRQKLRNEVGSLSVIPVIPAARKILEQYRQHPFCRKRGTLLPMYTNQVMNRKLKVIAEMCGINMELTCHRARHTFATTITLSNGVPLHELKTMMGHSTVKQTEKYARTLQPSVVKRMKALGEILEDAI